MRLGDGGAGVIAASHDYLGSSPVFMCGDQDRTGVRAPSSLHATHGVVHALCCRRALRFQLPRIACGPDTDGQQRRTDLTVK